MSKISGPELFYTGKLPFLMAVDGGVTVHRSGGSTEVLGKAQAIDGSNNINGESIVSIDWKGKMLKMTFNTSNTDFILLSMDYSEGSKQELNAKTSHGYKVEAPRGLAWACEAPGMFKALPGGSIEGITLPGVRIQANFDDTRLRRFGPLWYCGEVMPIALWVGLIVSLFFAYICYWGFSMLASINTMDRFDDPKGKQIYVPQSD